MYLSYCIRHIFRESNFSRIGTSRHFCEWLNSRSRRRAIMDGGRRNQYHSLICTCIVYCTTSIAYTQVAFLRWDYFRAVVEFANSTRLAKFAKIKPPRNIWRIQYSAKNYSFLVSFTGIQSFSIYAIWLFSVTLISDFIMYFPWIVIDQVKYWSIAKWFVQDNRKNGSSQWLNENDSLTRNYFLHLSMYLHYLWITFTRNPTVPCHQCVRHVWQSLRQEAASRGRVQWGHWEPVRGTGGRGSGRRLGRRRKAAEAPPTAHDMRGRPTCVWHTSR